MKLPEPVARYPPPHNPFSCWRDPFCLVRGDPGAGREWVFLLASGVTGRGGAVLVYKARHLLRGEHGGRGGVGGGREGKGA